MTQDHPEAPPKRGRPRRETRPDEILEAALAEFSEKGFERTRLDDVARRAGIAKGTLYLYHADKETLFRAMVRSRVLPTLDAVDAIVESSQDTTAALLTQVLATMYRRIVDSDFPKILRILVAEGPRFPELLDFHHREAISKLMALLRKIIARGVARGELRDGPAARLPQVVVAPAIVAALWRITFNRHDPIEPEAFLEAHVDLLLNGLTCARPDER